MLPPDVQWLGLHFLMQGGASSIPDWGSGIPHAFWPKTKNRNTVTKSMKISKNNFFFKECLHIGKTLLTLRLS